jgi:hypothetical protein
MIASSELEVKAVRLLNPTHHNHVGAIEIASISCDEDWHAMQGDDKVRFCTSCRGPVFNTELLDESELRALILEKEGSNTKILYRRADGNVQTRLCPIRRIKYGLKRVAFGLLAVIIGLGTPGVINWCVAGSRAG